MSNVNLHKAKTAKNDEFYTRYEDIEKEIVNYDLEGMSVYCNCDDYRFSNFVKYFKDNFSKLKIKHLTATNYDIGDGAFKYEYDGIEETITELNGCGDFSDEEGIAELIDCDVVVTNPPFSLFRDFVGLLMKYEKKFLIIGNGNAVTYKEIFPLIKENKVWMGVTMNGCQQSIFIVPSDNGMSDIYEGDNGVKMAQVNNAAWFTNIEHNRRNQPIDLYKKYNAEEYPKYDNYDAIECGKVAEIPMDYDGVIGVPISYIGKHCPEQFEIVDAREVALNDKQKNKKTFLIKDADSAINGKATYARIAIRRKA